MINPKKKTLQFRKQIWLPWDGKIDYVIKIMF